VKKEDEERKKERKKNEIHYILSEGQVFSLLYVN